MLWIKATCPRSEYAEVLMDLSEEEIKKWQESIKLERAALVRQAGADQVAHCS